MEEVWKDIKEYEDYQVSNLGRIRKKSNEYVMKLRLRNDGYISILLRKNKKQKQQFVHRLVYEAFNGEIPEGMQVNHINEDKTDNRLENLNLLTPKANSNWGTRTNRQQRKMINGKLSKPVLQYSLDNDFIKEWPSMSEIERQLGYDNGNIAYCCNGRYKQAYGYIWKYKKAGY